MITSIFSNGLCNRLFEWEIIYAISKYYNIDIRMTWSELEYLIVPNTTYIEEPFKQDLKPIDLTYLQNIESLHLEKDTDYYVHSCWNFNRYLPLKLFNIKAYKNHCWNYQIDDTSPIHFIQPIKKIQDIIDKQVPENFCSLHIRKGDYVSHGWDYPISHYVKICKKINDVFGRDFPIYLATNGSNIEIKPLTDEFNIIMNQHMTNNDDVHKIIDLFSLTKSKFIVGSESSFTIFASQYAKIPYLTSIDNYNTLSFDL